MNSIEWLLKNNNVWRFYDHITSTLDENTIERDVKALIKEGSAKKAKDGSYDTVCESRDSKPSRHRNVYAFTIPLVCGEIITVENAAFIGKEDIVRSRENMRDFLSKNVVSCESDGIHIKHNATGTRLEEYLNAYDNVNGHFSGFGESTYSGKPNNEGVKSSTIWSTGFTSAVVLYPSSIEAVLDENNKPVRNKAYSILDKYGYLRVKFAETDDFVVHVNTYGLMFNEADLRSMKNFPHTINGCLQVDGWYGMRSDSLEGFPSNIKNDAILTKCIFPENISIPSGINIEGNICIDGINEHHMLKAIADSDIKIGGIICSSLFTGSIEKLRYIINS